MYRAVVSFCGKVSMAAGQVGDIPDKSAARGLLAAGYIVEEPPKAAKRKPAKKAGR